MNQTDEVAELCQQLEGFHISARLQRQADEAALALKPKKAPKHDARWYLNELPFALQSGLSSPEPGCRPCWEPPVLDYSWFETLLEAEKELAAKEGNRDVAWRRGVTDNYVERILLSNYDDNIWEQAEECREGGRSKELPFWEGLRRDVLQDFSEVGREYRTLGERHGRTREEQVDLMSRLRILGLAKDANFTKNLSFAWI